MIFQSECQSRYISACLVEMIEQGIAAIDVNQDVHDRYISKVDAEHEQLIWTDRGMTTYYRNSKGRVFSAMPWRFVDSSLGDDPRSGFARLPPDKGLMVFQRWNWDEMSVSCNLTPTRICRSI